MSVDPRDVTVVPFLEEEPVLSAFLSKADNAGSRVRTHLQASDRVIARVTDGIYREPASALRELISNAWDADAKTVTILTDAPRYDRIYVRDDGNGMSYQALSYLLKHIGGSAKRNIKGQSLGVTDEHDADRSPGGRRLIGKVGIGLFSVSQLARRFRIVTKVKGEAYRLIAEVTLRAYSEDDDDLVESDDSYISGIVEVVRQEADDLESHGTDLILEDIKPRVRDILTDRDRWVQVLTKATAEAEGDHETASAIRVSEPVFHTGLIDPKSQGEVATLAIQPNLPWSTDSNSEGRMSLLMDAVEKESSKIERPDLATTLDAYLNMIWTLGLSAPVRYVDVHPFDLPQSEQLSLYWISNEQRGQAIAIEMKPGETVRDAVRNRAPKGPLLSDGEANGDNFRVFIDSIEVRRPIRFRFVQSSEKGLQHSLLFVGKYTPNLSSISADRRGGGLEMEGYLFWNGRIIPKENNGVLVRIRGTSGAVFDPTFFKYQVAELTRLKQLTSELFVHRGLDAALNIDRESFNFSHPHVQLVALWLQRAIRQLTNKHKDLTAAQRERRFKIAAKAATSDLDKFVEKVWAQAQPSEQRPDVFLGSPIEVQSARSRGSLALNISSLQVARAKKNGDGEELAAKVRALTQVLAAFRVLEDRTFEEQERLVDAILQIFCGVEK